MDKINPAGYWPKGMDSSIQANSVRRFESEIYTCWAPIEKLDSEHEAKMGMSELFAPGQVLFECKTLHKQDLAIHASEIKPFMINLAAEKVAKIQKQDTRARREYE